MGLFRKMLSVSTIGAIDFRSDKERTAAYTRETMRQAKAQTKLLRGALADEPTVEAEADEKVAARKAADRKVAEARFLLDDGKLTPAQFDEILRDARKGRA